MFLLSTRRRAGQTFWDQLIGFGRRRCCRKVLPRCFRPVLLALEDRVAPAVFNVPADVSLTAAIAAADANGDAQNTINLARGTYQVIGQQIQAAPAKTLVIAGQGQGVVLQSDGASNRVLEIDANVALENLTIFKGFARDSGQVGGSGALGGGLLIDGGDVTLSNLNVSNRVLRTWLAPARQAWFVLFQPVTRSG